MEKTHKEMGGGALDHANTKTYNILICWMDYDLSGMYSCFSADDCWDNVLLCILSDNIKRPCGYALMLKTLGSVVGVHIWDTIKTVNNSPWPAGAESSYVNAYTEKLCMVQLWNNLFQVSRQLCFLVFGGSPRKGGSFSTKCSSTYSFLFENNFLQPKVPLWQQRERTSCVETADYEIHFKGVICFPCHDFHLCKSDFLLPTRDLPGKSSTAEKLLAWKVHTERLRIKPLAVRREC